MGNEQSGTNGGISTSLSFLSGKKGGATSSNRKVNQVVTVKTGADSVSNPSDDEVLKRFKEIPKFYPILKSALNQAGLRDPPDVLTKMSYRPILKFAYRIQEHLTQCAVVVSNDQNSLCTRIKDNDYVILTLTNKLNERRKRLERLSKELQKIRDIQAEVVNIKFLLQEIVPSVETLNELLPVDDRLPAINLGRILDPPPVASSSEIPTSSEQNSRPAAVGGSLHIEPIEEFHVVDKTPRT